MKLVKLISLFYFLNRILKTVRDFISQLIIKVLVKQRTALNISCPVNLRLKIDYKAGVKIAIQF